MALIFSRSTYRFYRFKFRVLASQIALTSSLMMNGLNSPNLSPLDYEVWVQCWSLITSYNRSQRRFRCLKCTSVDFVCLTGENHWHWQLCESLSL